MKKFCLMFVFCAVIFAAGLSGCADFQEGKTEEKKTLTLMTWNLHNLFDGKDDGNEYAEFWQSSGWSIEKYKGRLNTISAAIDSIVPQPDVLIFQEIESLQVLEDLALSLPKGYLWSHFANNPESAIGLGILSRYPLEDAKSHSITIGSDSIPRPVLEAAIQTKHGSFVIFANHWKSKIGGDEATENIRKASARVILRRIRELMQNEPETGFIIAGDLNENFDEFYRRGSSAVCALMPDDPFCVTFTGVNANGQNDFIVINGNKPPEPVNFPKQTISLYSPWIHDLENGSYFYAYNWETIDHFLVSGQFFDNSGWEYDKVFIAGFEPFANANGIPVSYNVKTGYGLSDHLPLVLVLRLRE